MRRATYRDADGEFSIVVPAGWEAERDEEGGLLLSREEGAGLLHLTVFARDPAEVVEPADELYAFLAEHEIELQEDEVEELDLADGSLLAFCEYATEEEEEVAYWLLGVAAAPGELVFASYSCPLGDEDEERETVREIIGSLLLASPAETGGPGRSPDPPTS